MYQSYFFTAQALDDKLLVVRGEKFSTTPARTMTGDRSIVS